MTDSAKSVSKGGFLGFIERVGNKIPHPIFIFLFLIAVTMVPCQHLEEPDAVHSARRCADLHDRNRRV